MIKKRKYYNEWLVVTFVCLNTAVVRTLEVGTSRGVKRDSRGGIPVVEGISKCSLLPKGCLTGKSSRTTAPLGIEIWAL